MPTCGAARPTPRASYIVSDIVSTMRTKSPSISVTSLARCLSTGSPKSRMVYGSITSRVPRLCLGDCTCHRACNRPNGRDSHAGWIDRDPQPPQAARTGEIDGPEAVAERLDGWGAHERAGLGTAEHRETGIARRLSRRGHSGWCPGELG